MAKSAAAISLIPLAMMALQVALLIDDPSRWWNLASALFCAAGFGWCLAMAVKR